MMHFRRAFSILTLLALVGVGNGQDGIEARSLLSGREDDIEARSLLSGRELKAGPSKQGERNKDQIDEMKKKYGGGKGAAGKTENKAGFDKMKQVAKAGRKKIEDDVKEAYGKCSYGDFACLKTEAMNKFNETMDKAKEGAFLLDAKRKQRRDKIKEEFGANGTFDMNEICPQCSGAGMNANKIRSCLGKCKKEISNDLMEEKMEECIESASAATCLCVMDETTESITKNFDGGAKPERSVQEGIKKAVCGIFKLCIASDAAGTSVAECKTAAEQIIDDATCITEPSRHILTRCMMGDLKVIEECDAADKSECFKDSMNSLVAAGFKKRQGKKLLVAQALKTAYEAFDDCNCTSDSATTTDCHAIAQEAFGDIISFDETSDLTAQYNKIKAKVEELAAVVCAGGETILQLLEVLSVEFSDGDNVCSGTPDPSAITAKVQTEGLGALQGTADCAVEFNKSYVKAKYAATGKTEADISTAADNIVNTLTVSARRLTATYDEVYADQDSAEVSADSTSPTPSPASPTPSPNLATTTAASTVDFAQKEAPMSIVLLALAMTGLAM